MKTKLVVILLTLLVFLVIPEQVYAHQSGCHRWHSCPSDTGSYVCGDLGYTSQCPSYYSPPKKPEPSTVEAPTLQTMQLEGTEFELNYTVLGGTVSNIKVDTEAQAVVTTIKSTSEGVLGILLPREVIDSKVGEDDAPFVILVDDIKTNYEEKSDAQSRLVSVIFPAGTDKIEIIGTYVVPEFDTIAMLVLMTSIIPIVLVSKFRKFSF